MKIGIIGGGAAGLMAAAIAKETNPQATVTIFERNPVLGTKVSISGGGRCNVTTGLNDPQQILTRYPRGAGFLKHALYRFPPTKVREWFSQHGVDTVMEEDYRVFPASNHGGDIVDAFQKLYQENGTKVLLKTTVTKIDRFEREFIIHTKTASHHADKLIITTGGQAYRHTGSQGDGYTFLQNLGHSITQLAPSLNAFISKDWWPRQAAGISLPTVTLTAAGKSWTGPILFTHSGITGPAVFALSSLIAFQTYTPKTPLIVSLDLYPHLTLDQLWLHFRSLAEQNPTKHPRNLLKLMPISIPGALMDLLLTLHHTPLPENAIDCSKETTKTLFRFLKATPLNIVGRSAGEEFVTAGGITLQEVDHTTMESKLVPGLYIAGEILDIDGFTGGFNLQAAWCTGALAGKSAAK